MRYHRCRRRRGPSRRRRRSPTGTALTTGAAWDGRARARFASSGTSTKLFLTGTHLSSQRPTTCTAQRGCLGAGGLNGVRRVAVVSLEPKAEILAALGRGRGQGFCEFGTSCGLVE